MQAAGVRPIVDSRSLAVVGIVEVLAHIPRIYGEFRKLVRAARQEKPDLAILTDSPDFHLRLAKKLHVRGIPVVYLIAPQAWAWREGRVRTMRRTIQRLLCIFPFEKAFFEERGVPTTFIGHPLARIVKPTLSRAEFCAKFGFSMDDRIVALLPGSRHGEVARHMPYLIEAARKIGERQNVKFVLALPPGFSGRAKRSESAAGASKSLESRSASTDPDSAASGTNGAEFWERIGPASIQEINGQMIEGHTWDCLAQSEVALAASGTVTVEAALLGTPLVTFYRVNELSWILGRWMVRAPHLSMVNLVAGRRVAAELIQSEMTADRMAAETIRLLESPEAREAMRAEWAEVARKLRSERDPMEIAAACVEQVWNERSGGASGEQSGKEGPIDEAIHAG